MGIVHAFFGGVGCYDELVGTGVTKKSVSGVPAVTSDPSVAGRRFKYQSYKSHRHGCDSAMFGNIRFVSHLLHRLKVRTP